METPLTPLEFARRARKIHGAREAVVDGPLRFTYAQFCDRCDAWAAALAALGVGKGDRVATIAPNTHQHLEQFYAIPQRGAVIVPMNYRLAADDFVYMANHSGATVLCVHADYLALIDGVRSRMPGVRHFVALEGRTPDGSSTKRCSRRSWAKPAPDALNRDPVAETDLLAINYTSGTTSRPKGVMITHRNAWMNSIGTLTHWPMTPGDRYLWTLPMFHANGWTFTWTVTAAGAAHVCMRKADAADVYALDRGRAHHPSVRGSHRAHRDRQRAGGGALPAASRREAPHRGGAAGGGHHRAPGTRARLGYHACLRAHRNRAVHLDLRAAAGARRAGARRTEP